MRIPSNFLNRQINQLLGEPGKQDQTVTAILIIFLTIIILFGLRPTIQESLKINQELAKGKEIDKQLTQKIDNLNRAVEGANRIKDDWDMVNKALPENKDLPSILEKLNSIFGINNMVLEEVRFDGPKPSKDSNIFILPMTIQASGDYENVLATLSDIEDNSRQLDVTSISIEIPEKGNKQALHVLINIETYFLKKIYI